MGCQSSKEVAPPAGTAHNNHGNHETKKTNQPNKAKAHPLMSAKDRENTKEILNRQFQVDAQFVIHFSHVKSKMHEKLLQARETISDQQEASSNTAPKSYQSSSSSANPRHKTPRISFTQHSAQKPEEHLTREEKIIQGVNLLEQRLEHLQLEQCPMKDDGNCQFRTMAHQLFGNADDYHGQTRKACVQWLRQHSDEFSFFFESTQEWERYLTTMDQWGTWGDELTLKAASNVYQCTLHVITSEKEHYYVRYEPDHPPDGGKQPSSACQDIFLAYISPIHYNSIRLKKQH